MEERMIDDEYGRGVRLKKTADGYVDVTDELAEEISEELAGEAAETESDEVHFEFPMLDEDDEDLVGLSNEEAAALRKKKKEAAAKRKAKYDKVCAEGEALLNSGSYHAAELKFEKALEMDELATVASVGYWRAKTANFTDPDVLIGEYAANGIESLEYDLGLEATDIIKRDYKEVFEKRVAELEEEEKPLIEKVEKVQERRRDVLSSRVQRACLAFVASAIPFIVGLIFTIIYALKIPTVSDNSYVLPTAVLGGVTFLLLFVFIVFANRFLNGIRMYRKNERLSSTEEGERLLVIRAYKELYQDLVSQNENDFEFGEDEEE